VSPPGGGGRLKGKGFCPIVFFCVHVWCGGGGGNGPRNTPGGGWGPGKKRVSGWWKKKKPPSQPKVQWGGWGELPIKIRDLVCGMVGVSKMSGGPTPQGEKPNFLKKQKVPFRGHRSKKEGSPNQQGDPTERQGGHIVFCQGKNAPL